MLRERALALQGPGRARARIEKARATLNDARSNEELEAADHAPEAARGRQLLELLEEFNQPITPPVIAAFTDAAVREKLGIALRQSESAAPPVRQGLGTSHHRPLRSERRGLNQHHAQQRPRWPI